MMQHAACVIAAHCIVCCSTLRWVVHCTAFVKRKSHLWEAHWDWRPSTGGSCLSFNCLADGQHMGDVTSPPP